MRVLQDFIGSGFRQRFQWDCPTEHWAAMAEAKAYSKDPISPESSALFFYQGQDWLYGDAFPYGAFETLPRKDSDRLGTYATGCDHLTTRLSVYILKICFREMRHGTFTASFFEKWAASEDYSTNQHLKKLGLRLQENPNIEKAGGYTVAESCHVMEYMFRLGKWGSAFGGKKWAHIADTLHDFCKGKITAEMFCDRAFNLAHNTSPIFNKGGEFKTQNAEKLLKILNMQAAGTISEYNGTISPLSESIIDTVKPIVDVYPWTKKVIEQ